VGFPIVAGVVVVVRAKNCGPAGDAERKEPFRARFVSTAKRHGRSRRYQRERPRRVSRRGRKKRTKRDGWAKEAKVRVSEGSADRGEWHVVGITGGTSRSRQGSFQERDRGREERTSLAIAIPFARLDERSDERLWIKSVGEIVSDR
jgi:hypothetical protein